MTGGTEPADGITAGLFDLAELSSLNYRRHRPWRYTIAIGGFAVICVLGAVALDIVYGILVGNLSGLDYFDVGCIAFVACLTFSLCSGPVRFLAPPPIALSVGRSGLQFRLAAGRERGLCWEDEALWIQLVVRHDEPGLPSEARYRLWAYHRNGDSERPWRRVVPVAYLPPDAAEAVLESARAAHLSIARNDNARPVSLSSRKPCTVFRMARGYLGQSLANPGSVPR